MIDHTGHQARNERHDRRDEGSILLLVLVLIVIVGLVVAPLMSYALSVHRASASQSEKSRDVEAAKGGVRRALAEPADLFGACDSGVTPLGGPSMARGVDTNCQVVGTRRIKEVALVPLSIASVQADSMTPVGYASNTYANENTFAEHGKWLTTGTYNTASTAGTVWVPDLAVRATSLRPSTPVAMQPGAQNPAYASCDVFFPGTYQNALVIDKPVFFLSGVYYFEDTITFVAGADAVIGDGTLEGCTSDLEAVSYATTVPNPINGSGFGATFVLGDNARIVVDNSAGDVRVRFNQRYIGADEEGAAPSAGVSIVSVNGDHEVPGADLDLTGVIEVPASQVGGPSPEPAATAGYRASIHNSRPLPIAPANVTSLTTFQTDDLVTPGGGVTVGWNDPSLALDEDDTGVRITGYSVTSSPAAPSGACIASVGVTGNIQPTCTFGDLTLGQAYTFAVETLYDAALIGPAPFADPFPPVVSAPSASATPTAADPIAVRPTEPLNVALGASYVTGARIDWDPPAANGGAPVNSYTVTATPANAANPIVSCPPGVAWDATSCVVDGLVDGDTYSVEVVAGNRVPSVIAAVPGTASFPFTPTATPVPTAPPAPPMPVRVPDPIVDFDLTGTFEATVEILGYVSVPQGHIRIEGTSSNSSVKFSGGAVAAMFRPMDGAGTLTALPQTFQLDLTNPIVQKIIRLVSDTERTTATAIVQVNETGGWALNSLNVQ